MVNYTKNNNCLDENDISVIIESLLPEYFSSQVKHKFFDVGYEIFDIIAKENMNKFVIKFKNGKTFAVIVEKEQQE